MVDVLEIKPEKPDLDGLDTCRGEIVDVWRGWSEQARMREEEKRGGDLWML